MCDNRPHGRRRFTARIGRRQGGMIRKRRAISLEEKEARRGAILDAAWQLFQELPYDAVAMAAVAERAGLAKGTVYLYFTTKEELFLAIHEAQLGAWFDAIDARLAALDTPASDPIPRVAAIIGASLEERAHLARLLAILNSVLERNIDLATATRFKRLLLGRTVRTGALLERHLPFLGPGEGAWLLMQIHATVVGWWLLADPAPVVRQALQEPDLRPLEVQFAREFSRTLRALLYGMRALAGGAGAEEHEDHEKKGKKGER